MQTEKKITRRESLGKIARIASGLAIGAAAGWPQTPASAAAPAPAGKRFLVEAVGKSPEFQVADLVRKAFDAAGGIGRFVSRGAVVVVKPNISWARAPEYAATTHPEVLAAVVALCQEAGAKQVRIADNTIHDARQCFALSGAAMVAKNTGADLVFPRTSLMREMKIGGSRLETWPVFTPLTEADVLINLPIAKHHSLSTLTLGMKNWIGAVGGSRWSLHQDIHQTIVDLARFFTPTVTLIDAVRIMTANGPSGGSTADVALKNTLILSDDPVAADAAGALLFGRRPEEIGFIRLAAKQGLGTSALEQLDRRQVSV
jgi:uncharacterized protein (DUF362 family)